MNLKSLALVIFSVAGLAAISNTAFAELTLPSGTDRRPDLSLDPFERAREALRKLPSSEEKKQAPEPQRESVTPPEPPIKKPQEQTQPELDTLDTVTNEKTEPFTYEFAITVDAQSIASGGRPEPEEGAFEQNRTGIFGIADFVAEVDTGAAHLWDNGLFFLYTTLGFGSAAAVGDLQGTSGIYVGANTMRIVEAWYEHSFPHSHSSFLFGWHDYNGEFFIAEYANLFMNGALGSGQAITNAANPSSFPSTTLGFRFKTELSKSSYFQIGIYDGTFSDEALNKLIEVGISKDDGAFVIGESGYLSGDPGASGYLKIALGAWYLRKWNYGFETAETDPESGEPIMSLADDPSPQNSGIYFIAEASIGENLGLFFKHERAIADYNQIGQYFSAGLNYKGIIPGREEDVLGIAMGHARQTKAYLLAHNNELFVGETNFEITYTTQITDWLMLQPDIQYIQQPSMEPSFANATVISIQVQAVF